MADKHSPDAAGPAPAVTDPPQTDEAQTAAAESPETSAIKRERDDLYDRLLRKTAEFDNYRKRIERERREQADQAVVDLLQDLLLVVDDFDLALERRGGRRREELPQGRRADPREAAGPPAEAGRAADSRRSAPISIRTCIRPWRTRSAPSTARAKSSAN